MEDLKTNKEIQNKICAYCFDNLQKIHKDKEILDYPSDLPNCELPIFITWMFKGILRGCIGTFKAELLSKLVPVYSFMAAFKDSRFPPIGPKEVPFLSCGVSFLSDFEQIDDPCDWEVGKHGIEIEFIVDNKEYRGTYLPHVASEQNWNQEETLDSLLKKAGYKSGTLDDVRGKFSLIRRYCIKASNLNLAMKTIQKSKKNKAKQIQMICNSADSKRFW